MARFIKYFISFSITHLFFAVFIFFGLGIFVDMPDELSSFINLYIVGLSVIATIAQSLIFTILSKFFDIAGITFLIIATGVELLISNALFFYFINNKTSWDELSGSLLINLCLIASIFITMLIREYNAQSLSE